NFEVPNFELDIFVDVGSKEAASEWIAEFQSYSKSTMPQTRGYDIKGNRVLFREKRHCLHSYERHRLPLTHPLEVNIKVREELLNLFKDGHSPTSALYVYQDELHLRANDEQELIELFADRSINPDYDYTAKLFQEYRKATLGNRNGESMFERLAGDIKNYNDSDQGKAILQAYDTRIGKVFILCIVTNLMSRVHEKVPQAGELCYVDASASFESLNTSITLLYTSCTIGALLLGLFIMSDKLEVTLERVINILKIILPSYAFYSREPQTGSILFLTDDSSAERNALELYYPKGICLLCTFHILQSFWRWLHDVKHHIRKEDRASIMAKMKKIIYAALRLPTRGNNTNNYIERSFGILKDIVFARTQIFNCVQVFQFIITNMERFYEYRLLNFVNKHSDHLRIAKCTKQNTDLFYIVNIKIGICSCFVGISGAQCKHQEAVSVKFGISTFNYIPLLTLDDRILYTYIAL
ncbi:8318_t:CDS:2, partial [Funneliformis caledonium]